VQTAATSQPLGEDILLLQGFPLDALPAALLVPLAGWSLAIPLVLWLWLVAAGWSAWTFAIRWLGASWAALTVAVAWQGAGVAAGALAVGATGLLPTMALLPAALMLWREGHTRGFGVISGVLLLTGVGAAAPLALCAAAFPDRLRSARGWIALLEAVGIAVIISLPVLAWTAERSGALLPPPRIPWVQLAVGMGLLAAVRPRWRTARPAALLLAGGVTASVLAPTALVAAELGGVLWIGLALSHRERPWAAGGLALGIALQSSSLPTLPMEEITPRYAAFPVGEPAAVWPDAAAPMVAFSRGISVLNAAPPGPRTGWHMERFLSWRPDHDSPPESLDEIGRISGGHRLIVAPVAPR